MLSDKKYRICEKLNNKDCPSMELQFSDAVEVANNMRRRRSAVPRRRRSSKADTTPDDKFFITGEMFVYLMDQFEPKLTGFAEWAEQNYAPGSISSDSQEIALQFCLEPLLTRLYRLPLRHDPTCHAWRFLED